jgi:hypothetical protein
MRLCKKQIENLYKIIVFLNGKDGYGSDSEFELSGGNIKVK